MKSLIILVFYLTATSLLAQDYQCIKADKEYYYSLNGYTRALHVD